MASFDAARIIMYNFLFCLEGRFKKMNPSRWRQRMGSLQDRAAQQIKSIHDFLTSPADLEWLALGPLVSKWAHEQQAPSGGLWENKSQNRPHCIVSCSPSGSLLLFLRETRLFSFHYPCSVVPIFPGTTSQGARFASQRSAPS